MVYSRAPTSHKELSAGRAGVVSPQVRDFYAAHSLTSDPGPRSVILDGLPVDIEPIIDVIGGLFLHPTTAIELLGESEPADRGAGELAMNKTLRMLSAVDPAPLGVPRPVEKRLRVNCRGFAMMFVTILRHQGVPARKRVGFASYLSGSIHEIAEYWNDQLNRWVLVDPDPTTREPLRNFFASTGGPDQHDSQAGTIKAGDAFYPGGRAWRLCRSGQANAEQFRDSEQAGMAGVRVALIQDLDSLNKVELRSFDEWHEMINTPWDRLGEHSLAWLDHAANSHRRHRHQL